MADISFEDILRAVQNLNSQQKARLAQSLDVMPDTGPTREELIAELETLRAAGAFNNAESLRNKYANSASSNLTDEQLAADIHEAATEWEKELDEFFGDED